MLLHAQYNAIMDACLALPTCLLASLIYPPMLCTVLVPYLPTKPTLFSCLFFYRAGLLQACSPAAHHFTCSGLEARSLPFRPLLLLGFTLG
ncbi:predicted protein [Plenodomus lingam JN3]|uniref:Predicted protein n=1 Tax=Leptosphaeria maculans (strain JN3 / isolate v23.1.3 / race Av1-4-5-6-7-8) TaxID=985895 RepID=E5A8D4_LEPMJ|nr:predicted protein [Plenodomus lingam JN3]CBX99879.1 predicted protein [Plenodomus lingam JN3]